MTDEMTLEDLDNSIVGRDIPVEIDWISGDNQITSKIFRVKIAEPYVIDKLAHKYVSIDRSGKPKKMTEEQENRLAAEMYQKFMVRPDLSALSLEQIYERVVMKITLTARESIQNAIRGKLDDIMTLEEETLKNLGAGEFHDMEDLSSQPSTTDSS